MKNINGTRPSYLSQPLLWAILVLYILIASYTMLNHELWGDEFHSWNIAKASNSFFDLIHNSRYEGHPPVWYTILWIISKFTHSLQCMQVVHLTIAIIVVFVMLFYSPLPTATKVLLPFGYYFLFEYAILSRNYAIGVLAGFLICIVIHKEFKYKLIVYYALLFFMSNVHLLAMLLAGSLHLYFLIWNVEQKKKRSIVALHILLGTLIFLPAMYFIAPPSDGNMNMGVLVSRWSPSIFAMDIQAPLRAFAPMPAWWQYNFWNTHFLLVLHGKYRILKFVSPLLAYGFVGLGCYILKENKKSVALFLANVVVTFIIGNLYALATQRYSGFIFIGFITAYWLYCYDRPLQKNKNNIVNILLVFQLIAGVFIVSKDISLPFSNSYRVKEAMNQVPPNEKLITDYWALNTITAYTDKPFYCLTAQKTLSFLSFGSDITPQQLAKLRHIYCDQLSAFFQKEKIDHVYILSIESPLDLSKLDTKLYSSYHVQLTYKIEGAIEKGSNIYLYRISSL
ncbi:MAG TPA: hypothetical protein VK718_12375 [Ferruginibacter sp.]|jgi:hypothetical protein|nr:hypothetical protein [Ferruginibacter sp.]